MLLSSTPAMAKEMPRPDLIDLGIEALARCESSGRSWVVNSYDRHGDSIGLLQFRRETFREQMMKYKLLDTSDWEPADWENWMYDGSLQKKLARLMIEDGQIGRWGCRGKYEEVINNSPMRNQ